VRFVPAAVFLSGDDRFLAMFANINLALGLATFLGWVAGLGLFVITVFSVSHEIILGGVVVAMLIALFLFVVFYYLIARIPAKDRAPAAMAVVVVLHAVLVVANVIAVIFGVPLVYGALFNPRISNAVPVTETSVFAAVVTCAVLSLGLLVEKSLRPTGSLQRQ
jgi:glucan phosphoethanolaminetransferase (alkaline phosphatase superfamily)